MSSANEKRILSEPKLPDAPQDGAETPNQLNPRDNIGGSQTQEKMGRSKADSLVVMRPPGKIKMWQSNKLGYQMSKH